MVKDFSLLVKQCYCIAWSVKKIQKVKIQKLQRQKIIMLLWKCVVCDSKKLKFIKEQEASRLFSNLGI